MLAQRSLFGFAILSSNTDSSAGHTVHHDSFQLMAFIRVALRERRRTLGLYSYVSKLSGSGTALQSHFLCCSGHVDVWRPSWLTSSICIFRFCPRDPAHECINKLINKKISHHSIISIKSSKK